MIKRPDTFRKVGIEEGLGGRMLERYIAYMDARWHNTEAIKCATGYAQEWVDKFLNGMEYEASDVIGKDILKEIDK